MIKYDCLYRIGRPVYIYRMLRCWIKSRTHTKTYKQYQELAFITRHVHVVFLATLVELMVGKVN